MRGMRIVVAAALLLAACQPTSESPTRGGHGIALRPIGCERSASHDVSFTSPNAEDVIETRSFGPRCDMAVIVWTLRADGGRVLWTHSLPYEALATAQDLTSVPAMDAFLQRWAQVSVDDTAASPAWPADAELLPAEWGPLGGSMFPQPTYETIRDQRLPRLCMRMGERETTCLFYDPRAEAVDVHFRSAG
jgi:hypothetical protein